MPAYDVKNILVIEDNPGDFLLTEEFLLEQLDFPVITQARSYQEAMALMRAASNVFDNILLDLSLPDKQGEALLCDIVEIAANTPIIVLTGYTDLSFGVRSLSLGASDYLLKEELTAINLLKSIIYSIERKKNTLKIEASERRIRSFAKELSNVIEEDRARIAREIHDEFGQQLSGIKMSLAALKKSKELSEEIIDGIIADVDTGIQTLRKIANELRPAILDKLGLFAAVEWLVNEVKNKTGIRAEIYVDAAQPALNHISEINIFRICQEALTNIVKHARATVINVQLEFLEGLLFVRITDNGVGIAPESKNKALSMGLINMQERASLINADLFIKPATPSGTSVELIFNTNGTENTDSGRPLGN